MACRPIDSLVVVDQDAVMEDGDISRFFELAVLENGGEENDVESLPLAGFPAGVDLRRHLPVDGGSLAIRIERCRVCVEYLNLE